MSTNCPNCGAPIASGKCEYCGTRFDIQGTDKEIELLRIKTKMLEDQKKTSELYGKALKVMREYATANEIRAMFDLRPLATFGVTTEEATSAMCRFSQALAKNT